MTEVRLQLYDTKERKVRAIQSADGSLVRIYCCGPTVYRDAHVGNLRTFLLGDLVVRALHMRGVQTKFVQNITDVGHMAEDFAGNESEASDEDKVLSEAKKLSKSPFDVAREYEAKFHNDLALLNITPADAYPRASECIDLMQHVVGQLLESDNAYIGSDGTVYFSAESFPTYGAISGNRLEALKPGHRYEYQANDGKRFHADWALWKAAGHRTDMVWDSPWGSGFPGWHIECSAMSLELLDAHIDLHLGGIDLRFPHHENERAQSNAIVGREAVNQWVHGEHLLFEGRKMSKSAGNVVLVSDVVAEGIDPLAIRLCFLENRYRSQMDLTWDSLRAADSTIQRWRSKVAQWNVNGEVDSEALATSVELFLSTLEQDLDTPRAIQLLRNLERSTDISPATKAKIFLQCDQFLAIDLQREPEVDLVVDNRVAELLAAREQARANREFGESDRLRDELATLGIQVQDTNEGQKWVKTY